MVVKGHKPEKLITNTGMAEYSNELQCTLGDHCKSLNGSSAHRLELKHTWGQVSRKQNKGEHLKQG